MIPIRPDILAHAVLSGSRLNAQSRARDFFSRQVRTGGRRLHTMNGDRETPRPDFDSKHLMIPEAPQHGQATRQED